MTTALYFIIAFLAITVFVGALFAAFQAGKESGICKYDYIEEEENEIPKNDE
jgi:hypothetical protein